jgi:glycosyltransferase involved in cell wall biosynthesis
LTRAPGMPLRVFHLTTAGDVLAGAEQLLVGIARAADRAQWSLAFGTLMGHDKLHDAIAEHGWPVHALDIRGFASLPSGLARLRAQLAAFRPDVLHAHLFHASLLAALTATLDRRLVVVQTRHYSDYIVRFRPRRARVDAWAARRCDRLIAVSESARAQLVDSEGVARERVVVIDNGVDWRRLAALDHAEGRRRLEALGVQRGIFIGCAARFDIQKGHRHLLEAFVRVSGTRPEARLVLLGEGPEEAAIRADASRLGISERVYFLGHRADGHSLMAGLDLYVQPSVEEGFGLAVIEAMAMRRPVIGTAIGGMLQTIEPNHTGLHVPAAAPAALAEAVLALLDDPDRAATLGRNASERVRARYSLERMLTEYGDAYSAALATSRAVNRRP